MSADDWQGCPVCEEYAKEYYGYAKNKLPYDVVKVIEDKKNHLTRWDSDSWSPDNDVDLYIKTDDKLLDKILEWADTSIDSGTPVRIDWNYSLDKDGTYDLGFSAECNNCGKSFKEK